MNHANAATMDRDLKGPASAALLIAALIWLGLAASQLVWTLLPAPTSTGDSPRSEGATRDAGGQTPDVDLVSLHLFGQAAAQVRPTVAEAPETQLNLTLLGTLAGEIETQGMAIIADESGAQAGYQAGDELPGGATLREIYADRVVLERGGVRESLRLERNDNVVASGNPQTTRGPRPGTSAPLGAPPDGIDWQAIRNQSRVNPQQMAQLAQNIRALPFTENGKPIGVRLMATRDASMLTNVGLRSSDIVLSVNDIPLSDPSRQPELLGLLQGGSNFRVRIRRNGREMTLDIDASKLK